MDPQRRRASAVERVGDILVISLWDREYISWSGDEPEVFQTEVIDFVVAQPGPVWLVLDYTKKTYLSSRHVGKLAVLNNTLRNKGSAMRLCSLGPQLLEVLRIVDPKASIFKTTATRAEAISELQALQALNT